MDICPKCGLPREACVCDTIAKSDQNIRIETIKRKFNKVVTLVSGLSDINLKDIARQLKTELACGGTIKNNVIELQGRQDKKTKEALIKLGFPAETIEAIEH